MLLGQLVLMAKITAQAVGITTSTTTATTFPASTLDVQGSLGLTLATNPASALTTGAVVLYNTANNATLVLPTITTTNTYLNRIYILANANTTVWSIAQTSPVNTSAPQTFFYNFSAGKSTWVNASSSVIIISDGINWYQIK